MGFSPWSVIQIDVQEVKSIFTADWQRLSFSPTDPHLIVSPDTARSGLDSLLTNAQNDIEIEMEVINDETIVQTLGKEAKTVHVLLIVPTISQTGSNKPFVSQLQSNGVEVKSLKSPYVHAKLVIADSRAYVGSVNFTKQSLDENRELGIIISQSDIVTSLLSDFESDWSNATRYQ